MSSFRKKNFLTVTKMYSVLTMVEGQDRIFTHTRRYLTSFDPNRCEDQRPRLAKPQQCVCQRTQLHDGPSSGEHAASGRTAL